LYCKASLGWKRSQQLSADDEESTLARCSTRSSSKTVDLVSPWTNPLSYLTNDLIVALALGCRGIAQNAKARNMLESTEGGHAMSTNPA
jgi:acyl-CoA reductase-like NAD-dependent aldehyde dehydrogenase